MDLNNPLTGIRLHYNETGAGDRAVILLHGWTSNCSRWTHLEELLSANFRVISYDLRGHGLSAKQPELDYGFAAHVLDLAGLMDSLSVPRAILVGHSMGGMIAQHFALTFPERVDMLALVATTACVATQKSKRNALYLAAGAFMHAFKPTMWLKEMHKRKSPDLYPDLNNPDMKPSPASTALCLLAIAQNDLRNRLPQLAIPTLVIASDADKTVPIERSQELADIIPGAKFVPIHGCSHHIQLERPDLVYDAIAEFAGAARSVQNAAPFANQ
ncbi:MAG: alpha/beta fold hydrolase [bacterium]